MKEAHHVQYHDIDVCEDFDKKIGMFVIDNYCLVFSPHIKKYQNKIA